MSKQTKSDIQKKAMIVALEKALGNYINRLTVVTPVRQFST